MSKMFVRMTRGAFLLLSVFLLASFLCVLGCSTQAPAWESTPIDDRQQAAESALSYGMVTGSVERNKSTQLDLLKLFGAPNITTTDSDGQEVWVYDQISTTTQSQGWSESDRFQQFFSAGVVGGGRSGSASKQGNSRSSTTRTLTVVVTFNEDKTVKEYSARATKF